MKTLLFGLLLIPALAAHAAIPRDGVWFVPSEPGSGLSLAYQHGVLFVVVYTFNEDTGSSTFFAGSGPFVEDGETEVELLEKRDGSCLWCEEYRESEFLMETRGATFTFSAIARGMISVDGGAFKPIRFFEFFSRNTNLRHPPDEFGTVIVPDLRGNWVFSTQTNDRLLMRVRFAGSFPIVDPPLAASFFGPSSIGLVCEDPDRMGFDEVDCSLLDFGATKRLAIFDLENVTTTHMEGFLVDENGNITEDRVVGVRISWDRGSVSE